MKKEIKINIQDLINALDDHSYLFDYFLDLENGKVAILPRDFYEDEEFEYLDGYNREIIENNRDRFISIDPIESHESFLIMEDFTLKLPDDIIKNKLNTALSKRKPFRNFKNELFGFPEVEKAWYKFHEDEMKRIAFEWLEAYGIKAELIDKHLTDKEKE